MIFPRLGRQRTILTGSAISIGLLGVGPIANSWIVDLTGRKHNMILAGAPCFLFLARLRMLGIRKGEAALV